MQKHIDHIMHLKVNGQMDLYKSSHCCCRWNITWITLHRYFNQLKCQLLVTQTPPLLRVSRPDDVIETSYLSLYINYFSFFLCGIDVLYRHWRVVHFKANTQFLPLEFMWWSAKGWGLHTCHKQRVCRSETKTAKWLHQ